ncbi:MAG: nucleotidyltransferase domain-containing protein [Anaerolineae bacterium]|nr:nucleotidyltransferase domain-containing protein [Anaerolineae bacterium]
MSKVDRTDRAMGDVKVPRELYPALARFVAGAHRIPNLKAAILFGSAVTGEFRRKSDVDVLLLFDTDHDPEMGPEAQAALALSAEIAAECDLAHPFSFVMENLRRGGLDPDFLWEAAREGIVIWAVPSLVLLPASHPRLEPALLVTYSTRGMSGRDKGALHRALYGYRVEKRVGEKVYVSEKAGLINEVGRRLGPGVVLVLARAADRLIGLLERHGATYRVTKVWR